MKVLVVTGEPISADGLRTALGGGDPAQDEIMVLAPALQDSPLKFWLSDADEAIERARAVWRESVDQLGREGVSATGETGASDPVQAIQDALVTFQADRIVLFTKHDGEHYREDVDERELEERFGVPITRAGAS